MKMGRLGKRKEIKGLVVQMFILKSDFFCNSQKGTLKLKA